MKQKIKLVLTHAYYWIVEASTRVVYIVSPREKIYDNLFLFCDLFSKCIDPFIRIFSLNLTTKLFRRNIFSHSLTTLNSFYRNWRPRYCVNGLNYVDELCNGGDPFICCSVHFSGMPYAVPKIFDDLGYEVVLITAVTQRDGWDWGMSNPATLLNRNENVLLRLRGRLKKRTVALVLVDYDYNFLSRTGSISPNLFRFSKSISAPVLFFVSRLLPDGSIHIEFGKPDQDKVDGDAVAEQFGEWLNEKIGWTYKIADRPRSSVTAPQI